MAQPSTIAKELSSSHGDRLVRVLVADEKSSGFRPLTFSEFEIQGVAGLDKELSALVLRSGVEIPVALPYEQLEQKIYQPDFKNDGTVLDLRAVTGEAAKPKASANTNQAPAPGDKMSDGTVFAGISPETNKPMFAEPSDAPLAMTFNEAQKYATKLDAHGHQEWRMPTKAELNVLFSNRAAIGGFDVTGSYPAGWYWSASPFGKLDAWEQRLSDGCQDFHDKDVHSSLRCVR